MADFLNVYDLNRQKTAVLQNAFNIKETQELNKIYTLDFSIPADDEKIKYLQPFHYVRYGETGDLYRIIKSDLTGSDTSVLTVECEHVIATLCDDLMFGAYQYGGGTIKTADVIRWLLSKQKTASWTLQDCDFERRFEYNWEQENILNALYSIPKEFSKAYKWSFNTDSYPWKISLKAIDATIHPEYYIRAKRNMLSSGTAQDFADICTRIYPLGYGEGVNQLGIAEVNGGVPYLQSPAGIVAQYGIKEKVLVDRRFENAESLKEYAQTTLDALQTPSMKRTFDVIDLYPLTGDDIDNVAVGDICQMTEDETVAYVTKTVRVLDKAGDLQIDLSTKATDIVSTIADLADRVRIESVYAQGATQLYQHSKDANATPDKGMVMSLYFPSEMRQINKVLMRLKLEKFRSYSQTTSSNGGFSQTYTVAEKSQTYSVAQKEADTTTKAAESKTYSVAEKSQTYSVDAQEQTYSIAAKDTKVETKAAESQTYSVEAQEKNYSVAEQSQTYSVAAKDTKVETKPAEKKTYSVSEQSQTYSVDQRDVRASTTETSSKKYSVSEQSQTYSVDQRDVTASTKEASSKTYSVSEQSQTYSVDQRDVRASTTETSSKKYSVSEQSQNYSVEQRDVRASTTESSSKKYTVNSQTQEVNAVLNEISTVGMSADSDANIESTASGGGTGTTSASIGQSSLSGSATSDEVWNYGDIPAAFTGATEYDRIQATNDSIRYSYEDGSSLTDTPTPWSGGEGHYHGFYKPYHHYHEFTIIIPSLSIDKRQLAHHHTISLNNIGSHSHSFSMGEHSHNINISHKHNVDISHKHNIKIPGHSHTIEIPGHDHSVTIPGHSHTIKIPGHSHTIEIPGHDHNVTIPGHSHTIKIPSHSHKITIEAHNHSVTIPGHSHTIKIPSHSHTIEIPGHDHSVTIPGHSHTIKIPSHSHTIEIPEHDHGITIPGHSHTIKIPSHSHKITIPGHSHKITIPAHDHALTIPGHEHKITIPGHSHKITIPAHSHTITIPSHNHKVTIPGHEHKITIPAHSHTITINTHRHDILAGIFESGNPTKFDVYVNGSKKTTVNATSYDGDITTWLLNDKNQIPRDSWLSVEIRPDDLAYVVSSVFVQGFVQSRGGGNY